MEKAMKVLNINKFSDRKKNCLYAFFDECTPIFNSHINETNNELESYVVMMKDGMIVAFLQSKSYSDGYFKYDIIAVNSPVLTYNWGMKKNIIDFFRINFYEFFKELRYISLFLGNEKPSLFKHKYNFMIK